MSRWIVGLVASCWLLLTCPGAPAQDVFVTRDADGKPVFSDKGQPGARPVTLPPLNVIKPVPVPPAGARGQPQADTRLATVPEAPAYRRLRIVFPEDSGSVAANTATFEVRVAVDPPLQLGEGHAIVVSINGRPVGQRCTGTECMVPPEFWGDTWPQGGQPYQLDAAIVDRAGQVLQRAAPVVFTFRYVAGIHRPPLPRPPPFLPPVSKPMPPPESAKQPFIGMERGPPTKGRAIQGGVTP